jgi:hypothetical protein
MLTVKGAAQLLDRSVPSAAEAIERLVTAGILSPTTVGRKRGQVYEARDVIDAFTALTPD